MKDIKKSSWQEKGQMKENNNNKKKSQEWTVERQKYKKKIEGKFYDETISST